MITLSQRREVGEFRKRYRWMALFVVLVFGGIVVRVAQVQLFQRDRWSGIAQQNITKTLELPATRGVIRDIAGRVVASNRPSYDVYATPRLFQAEDVDRIASLMELSAEDRDALQTRMDELPPNRRTHQIELYSDVDREQLAALETHLAELPALDIITVPLRDYPYATLGAHVIGYLNEVNAQDLERSPDPSTYRSGDRIGRSGLEKRYEPLLKGSRGFRRVVVDARGKALEGARPDSLEVEMVRPRVSAVSLRGSRRRRHSHGRRSRALFKAGLRPQRNEQRPQHEALRGAHRRPVSAIDRQDDVRNLFSRLDVQGHHRAGRTRRCGGRPNAAGRVPGVHEDRQAEVPL
jgi:hypothetical protein